MDSTHIQTRLLVEAQAGKIGTNLDTSYPV
jgi:hypothetical protein